MKSGDWTKRPHVDVMSDKEARDQAKASKKKKHSNKPKPNAQPKLDDKVLPSGSNSSVDGSGKIPNPPSKTKTKNQVNKSKNSVKFNNLSHKHSTGATNWQKFLAEAADGVIKKVPTVKSTSIENRQNSGPKKVPAQNQMGPKITKVVAMDCEMVGVGENGRDSILARVSVVNVLGDCIYDKYVKPREEVTDYRTFVSGIREEDLLDGEDFMVVQREVGEILRHRILVGHAIKNDLEVLFLTHPRQNIRDTAKFFRKGGGRTPSLKSLAAQYLDVTIQEGEHSSVQDAKATIQLYNLYRKQWELGGGNKNHNRIDTCHNKIRPQALRAEDT